MTLEQALQWADTFGAIQSSPPTGDAGALTALAAEVRRLQDELNKLNGWQTTAARKILSQLP
jgi:hypothetical protein